jgi:hypothetical protein
MSRKRQPRASQSARRRRACRSSRRRSALFVVLLVLAALVPALTLLTTSGQALPAVAEAPGTTVPLEASPEAAALSAGAVLRQERDASRQARHAENEAAAQARRQARREARHPQSKERDNVVVSVSCTQVVWEFRNFPELPGNTVRQKLKVNDAIALSTFTFDGATGTSVTPISPPPGKSHVDANGGWKTNGAQGGFDIGFTLECPPAPGFTVEKLQRIEGSGGGFTASTLTGQVGQTIEYEIVVDSTGNVPLSFAGLSDAVCDAGTVTGGPGGELAAGATATYTCKHVVSEADVTAGSISNTVTLGGTPPEGQGSTIEHSSNTVVVEAKAAGQSSQPSQASESQTQGSSTPSSSGVLGSSTAQPPKLGVAASTASHIPAIKLSVPGLKGPQGCVRSAFRASVKSAHVARVAFYLDGRRLRTMMAKGARHGLISITIDPTKLRVGLHELVARITMTKTTASAAAVHAKRMAAVVRCASAVLTPKFTG